MPSLVRGHGHDGYEHGGHGHDEIFFRGKYFSGVNIFQGWIFRESFHLRTFLPAPRPAYFLPHLTHSLTTLWIMLWKERTFPNGNVGKRTEYCVGFFLELKWWLINKSTIWLSYITKSRSYFGMYLCLIIKTMDVLGNLEGRRGGFPNNSRVLVECGHSIHH